MFNFLLEIEEHRGHRDCRFARGRGFGHHGHPGDRFDARLRGGFERGPHGPRERLFDAGQVRLVVLQLLSEEPSYGYQLMKRMEQRLQGGYMPSAGVIYPTLTMLEEEGLTVSETTEGNKKVYRVTEEGQEALRENQEAIQAIFERMDEAGDGFRRGRSPELMRAFMNLRGAVVNQVSRGQVSEERIQEIAAIIDEATRKVEELP